MPDDYFDEDDHSGLRFGDEHRERWRDIENIQAGTPAEKRRHHYVPQMWLRNWADPAPRRSFPPPMLAVDDLPDNPLI